MNSNVDKLSKKELQSELAKISSSVRPSIQKKFSEKQVIAAIDRCQGLTSPLMRELDCTYAQLNVYFEHHPKMKEYAEKCRNEIVSLAEEKLRNLLDAEDERLVLDAAKFILSRRDANYCQPQVATQTTIKTGETTTTIQQIFGIQEK